MTKANNKTSQQMSRDKIAAHVEDVKLKKILPSGLGQVEFPKETELPKLTGEYQAEFPLYSDLKVYSDIFGEDFFIINDLPLAGIPATYMNFNSSHDAFVAETLRSKAPVVTTKGIQNWTLKVGFVFPAGEEQSITLRRLVAEISKNPLIYIYNIRIRKALGIPDEDNINTIFILESGNIRNAPDQPGALVLDLQLHLFNYKPFSNHFWYNTTMPSYDREDRTIDFHRPKRLTDATGYEASSYALQYEAEWITDNIRKGVLAFSDKANVPVPFPASSDAWMFYADHLENTSPVISKRTNDYIGLSLNFYSHHSPPVPEAAAGGNTAANAYSEKFIAKNYPDIYNALENPVSNTVATERKDQKYAKEGQTTTYTGSVTIKSLKSGTSHTLAIVDENGNVISDALEKITELATDPVSPKARQKAKDKNATVSLPPSNFRLDTEILKRLNKIAERWPGKKITIVSGIRNYGFGKGQHPLGFALDIRVSGVTSKDVFLFYATNFKGGFAEYVPNTDFVHIDARRNYKIMICKTDTGTGGTTTYDEKDEVLLKARRLINAGQKYMPLSGEGEKIKQEDVSIEEQKKQEAAAGKEEAEHKKGNQEDIEEAQLEQMKSRVGDLTPWDAELAGAETIYTELQTFHERQAEKERSPSVRSQWKKEMWDQHKLHYYSEDPKIRNVFYSDIFQEVSNASLTRGGIVMTALSMSFGHRIVPQRLLSQDTYTWQFLGAGNKHGKMVFQFSGADGRRAADKIKQMVYGSRENARKFGSLIPRASAINVYATSPYDGTTNSILSLLDVNSIIVTEIDESPNMELADTHQMSVEFIVQDFEEEKFEKRFTTPLDRKKKVFRTLLSMLYPHKSPDNRVKIDGPYGSGTPTYLSKDNQWIRVRSQYVTERYNEAAKEIRHYKKNNTWIPGEGAGRPYAIKDKNMPIWLAQILIDTAELCRKIDKEAPSTLWSYDSLQTWRDRYNDWGANDLIKGRVHNIYYEEMNRDVFAGRGSGRAQVVGTGQLSVYGQEIANKRDSARERMDRGDFDFDGAGQSSVRRVDGKGKTSEKQRELFEEWINGMDAIYERLKTFITDEVSFDKYFKGLADEMYESVAQDLGGCYEDMDIPNVPTKQVSLGLPLPPEFYVYDDSKEDPGLSMLSDPAAMKGMLSRHMDNEIASIEHYLMRTACGGSYLSRHMPNIVQERKRHLDVFAGKDRKGGVFGGELGFMGFSGTMMEEGCKNWEPLFYRSSDPEYKDGADGGKKYGTKQWMDNILDGKSEEDARFKFMDDITALNPYLKNGHPSWDTSSYGDEYLIETIFDDNWRALSMGPNAEFKKADEVLSGSIPSPNSERSAAASKKDSNPSYINQQKRLQNKAITEGDAFNDSSNHITVTKGGTILLGKSELEEKVTGREISSNDLKTGLKIAAVAAAIPSAPAFGAALVGVNAIDKIGSWAFNSFKNKQTADYLEQYEGRILDNVHPVSGKFGKDKISSSVADLASGIAFNSKGKDLSVRRAFPTFKIYFIEDDSHQSEKTGGKTIRAFDDFYSYSAVQEIRISRNRKVAADMAVIRITNIGGKLLRHRFGEKEQWKQEYDEKYGKGAEYATGVFADTDRENPFERMMLKEGVKVQIRLGYANEPDNLETVFLGAITEISPSDEGKILQIQCQGFGAELEGVELGPLQDGPLFYSSQSVLSAAIIQDSIVNFGRRSKFNKFNSGEQRHSFVGGEGEGILDTINPARLIQEWGEGKMYRHFYRYPFRNFPQDDNIYAPPPSTYAGNWEMFWNNACLYRPIKQTPWEIFKEHELRHPGYISMAVPYGHDPRMTMFFGAKGQHYWSKPPSSLELHLAENASELMVQMRGMSVNERVDDRFLDKLEDMSKKHPKLAGAIIQGMTTFASPSNVGREVGRVFGRYKPFRNYHFFDSYHHILKNEIRSSSDGTFNEVEVLYFDDENLAEEDNAEDLFDNIRKLSIGGFGKFASKLDENIPEEHLRSYVQEFPSCVTEFMAKRYAQGLFARLLRDAYKGELIVLGDASIKPYDICYINDSSVNMTGPCEVEGVEHVFNRDNGWISIITPDLCIDVNEFFSASVFDVTGSALSHMWGGGATGDTLATLTALACPIPYLALVGGIKFGMWMQDGSPIIATPMSLGGKPFISVSLGQDRISMFTQLQGRWNQYWDDLGEAWRKLDIGETVFETKLSLQEKLYGFIGPGPGDSIAKAE